MFIQLRAATYVNLDNVVSIYPETSPDGTCFCIVFESNSQREVSNYMTPEEVGESMLRLKIILEDNYGVADQWLFKSTVENTDTQSKR
jgi:hypothetical protein